MRLALLLMIAGALLPAQVRIVAKGDGFQLEKGGQPYYIKGAGGTWRMDLLAAAGGNSCRTWGAPNRQLLDDAQKNGLTILAGIQVGLPRHGFNYGDAAKVQAQREKARQSVRASKGHPALLMWAVGNEIELGASLEQRLMVWKEVEQIARIVKQEDPDHPVITVIAGVGKSNLIEIAEHCPTLDAVGVNAYGAMLRLPEAIASQGWKKPWLVTEFGPRGHWEVAKTEWGMPIEDTSTEKAAFYEKAYAHAVSGQSRCLGSYVFLWGQKQEKTHTWYGMFLPDGTPLDTVDAISHSWTGQWPKDRAPRITGITVNQSEGLLQCSVQAEDPEGGTLQLEWDLRKDVSDNPSTGGDREEGTAVLAKASGAVAEIKLPSAPGNYRVFVYARDGSGKAATANRAVRVVPN